MCVCVCVLGRVLLIKSSGPGVTPTARLPVANQLFRIGCSGIKVDSPLYVSIYRLATRSAERWFSSIFVTRCMTCMRTCTRLITVTYTRMNNIIICVRTFFFLHANARLRTISNNNIIMTDNRTYG